MMEKRRHKLSIERSERMKQWSKWLAAGLLAAVLTVSVSAAPGNVEQSARGCMEAEQSTSHTPRAVRRLLEYLSELPEEQAILILGDAELLNNMMMDYYWEPYEEENPLAGFAQKKGIALEEQGEGAYILTGLTVDELSVKLRHQVIQKTDKDHRHDWMYFDVTDEDGNEKLFRHCQSCEKWQAFEEE